MIKMKIKALILLLLSAIFASTALALRSYNVPQYDETTESPGGGSGFSAPVTKFDIFSSDETDEVNYANTKVINITAGEEKTFTLDFYTIEWYGSYPTQELVFDIDNKEKANITYYKNDVESGTVDDSNTNKTITDSELPSRISGGYLNTEYPVLKFKLTGLVEGITSLDITVNSTHEYGMETNTSETLTILINVSATQLIDIPNYIYLMIGTGIHSGVTNVKYIENERIGILTDVVSSLKIVLPTEITDYNSSSTNQILYRIKGDSSIKTSGDYISFNNVTSGKTSIFSIEYYILDSNGNEIILNSYSFSFIFYSNSDIKVGYNYKEFPTDDIYEIGTPITIETTSSLKPYIEDLVVTHISGESGYLKYENGYPYVIKEVTDYTYIEFVDKLLFLSGLSGYINVSEPGKYAALSIDSSNVIEKTYPTEISLDSNYSFSIDNSLSEYIDILNISEFSNDTTFNVTSYGAINVEFTKDRRILLTYNSVNNITTTISSRICIEATLDNSTVLTKNIYIHLTPNNGYNYTFDKLSVSVLVGSSETITLGYLDPTFVEAKENVIENYYLKTGNAIVNLNEISNGIDEISSVKYNITGKNVGYDTAYFIVKDQIIEVSIAITEIKENETISFEFNEGIYIPVITTRESEYSVSVPNEYASYIFTFILFDKTIASLENVKNSSVNIKGLKDGITQLAAYTTVDNKTYNAIINIRVITSIPNVTLVTDKDDSTTLTKYDSINVSFNASSFEFSKNTTYKWYLNDVLFEEGATSINRCFDVGANNIKLVINDIDNDIEIEVTKEITIIEGVKLPDIVPFDLNEGKNLTILAQNEYTISVPNHLSNYLFTFIVQDNEIVSIQSVKNNMITVKGLIDGTTQITVTANIDDKIYSSIIAIRVITTIPTVNIVVEKEDSLTSFTKYDTLNVSFDASNFEFSKNTTYDWYLNDELIMENTKSFKRSFNEGLNYLKLIIKDTDNKINIESTQELNISSVENVQKTISINASDEIYVDLHQGSFEIEALLDGVVNPNYKYLWSVSNKSICNIKINGNEKIILEPSYVGEVDLTVMTNISKYEEVYIIASIKIFVIEPTYKLEGNNFIKPGSNQTFKLLGDEREIFNAKPSFKITVDGVEFTDYELNGNELIINEIPKGKYEISYNLNDSSQSLKFESTNFNIKEIAKVIAPYLIITCVIILIIAFAIKKRKSKLERTLIKINKLDSLANTLKSKDDCTKKDVNKLLSESNKLKKMFIYCVDEGIDEINALMPNIETLIKILVSTMNSNVDSNKIKLIIKNIKNRNIKIIIDEFMIIKDERDAFEQKKKVVDEIVNKKNKKVKVTQEEYETYLLQSKYAEDDDQD